LKGITQQAQHILQVLAQEEAKRMRSSQLYPEHIMLAIINAQDIMMAKIFQEITLDLNLLIGQLEETLLEAEEIDHIILGDVPPSNRGKHIIEHSAEESRILGNSHIGIEHLFLACFYEPESICEQYRMTIEIDMDMLRQTVRRYQNPLRAVYHDSEQVSIFAAETQKQNQGSMTYQKKITTPTLDEFSTDLTELARQKKLDPVLGRDREIRSIMRVLIRRNKNSPLLVGDPGIGKTAIVEGLAQRIVDQSVPEMLQLKRVLSLDLARLIAGTKYRGEFEERMKRVMKEIKSERNIVLFIDEIHTIVGAGGAEGAIDASSMLKPALSRREMQCIGATTLSEYKRYIEKDTALERRFQPIFVAEPTKEETLDILDGIKSLYEKHHRVRYQPQALGAAVELSQRYITERYLPDKAIDIIDEAGAKKRLVEKNEPADIQRLERMIGKLNAEKIALVSEQSYEKAALVRDEVLRLRVKIDSLKNLWKESSQASWQDVTEDDVYEVVSGVTGIPLARVAMNESRKLLHIEDELRKTVVGQEKAIERIAAAIRKSRAGLSRGKRPIGSFLFLGPTGVGKTLLAKTLAKYLFGNVDALIRLDMSDFMERYTVSRLAGAPPGYVGYEEGGFLTEKLRRKPYCVILFDEMEKAHRDVYNLLLQIMEEGELQDNLGHTVSFRNAILIMTSNVGSQQLFRGTVGFSSSDEKIERPASMGDLSRTFRPEFLNRLDEIVTFSLLSQEHLEKIFDILVAELYTHLQSMRIEMKISKNLKAHLIQKAYNPQFGARDLRRIISRELEDKISLALLEGSVFPHASLFFSLKNGSVHMRSRAISHVNELSSGEVQ